MYNYLKCVPSIFLIPIQIYFHKPSKNRSYAQIRTLVLSLSFVRVNSRTLAHVSNVFGFSEYHYNCIWYCIAIQMKGKELIRSHHVCYQFRRKLFRVQFEGSWSFMSQSCKQKNKLAHVVYCDDHQNKSVLILLSPNYLSA